MNGALNVQYSCFNIFREIFHTAEKQYNGTMIKFLIVY